MSVSGKILGKDIELSYAKEAMKKAVTAIDNDSFTTIEILSSNMIVKCQNNEKWIDDLKKSDAIVPFDIEVLNICSIDDRRMAKDISLDIFVKMITRYMKKNNNSIFVIASLEENLNKVICKLEERLVNVSITGMALSQLTGRSEIEVINAINDVDPDFIFSVLPSPKQEEFIKNNRSFFNARVWLGGGDLLSRVIDKSKKRKLVNFLQKKLLTL